MCKTIESAIEVSLSDLCELLTNFVTSATIDLGSTILHVGNHVHMGKLILVSTACGRAACITL